MLFQTHALDPKALHAPSFTASEIWAVKHLTDGFSQSRALFLNKVLGGMLEASKSSLKESSMLRTFSDHRSKRTPTTTFPQITGRVGWEARIALCCPLLGPQHLAQRADPPLPATPPLHPAGLLGSKFW